MLTLEVDWLQELFAVEPAMFLIFATCLYADVSALARVLDVEQLLDVEPDSFVDFPKVTVSPVVDSLTSVLAYEL